MKRLGWLLWAVVVVLASGLVLGADAKKKGGANKNDAAAKKKAAAAKKKGKAHNGGGPGEISLATMDREVNLSPQQRGKMKPLWDQRDQALADWDTGVRGRRLRDLELDLRAASGRDKSRVLAMIKPLREEREAAAARFDYKIRAILTNQQKVQWTAFLLWRDMVRLFKERINLTGSQMGDVRELCKKAAEHLPVAPDNSTMSMMRSKLARAIYDRVLTDSQRKTLNPGHKTAKKSSDKKRHHNKHNNRNRNNRNRWNRNRNRNKNKHVAKPRNVPMPKTTVGSAMNMKAGGGGAQNMKAGGGSSSGGKKK